MTQEITTLSTRAAEYAVLSHGQGTTRVYKSQVAGFVQWCLDRNLTPLPAEQTTIAHWLTWRADGGASLATIRLGLAAVKHMHKLADQPLGLGRAASMTLEGIARKLGAAPGKQAKAATADKLRAMVDATESVRDRAILFIGFGAALRRSEVAALNLADVTVEDRGVLVTVRASKTDQHGRGEVVAIARGPQGFDPVTALLDWLAVRGDAPGPLFGWMVDGVMQRLQPRAIHRVIVAAASRARLGTGYSGHSLRSGLITSAVQSGAALTDAARQARHAKIETTAGYVRHETAWTNNATANIFGGK